MREFRVLFCPQCKSKAAVVDPKAVLGVRKADQGGKVRLVGNILTVWCPYCGFSWDAAEYAEKKDGG